MRPSDSSRSAGKNSVFTEGGRERRFYELCVLAELKNALRSGDIWVQGSRQFKDFDEYLLPAEKFASLRQAGQLPLGIVADGDRYLQGRMQMLKGQLEAVNRMAEADELPDAHHRRRPENRTR